MLQFLKRMTQWNPFRWFTDKTIPENFKTSDLPWRDTKITNPEAALTLSPIFAGLRWYQTTLSSLPLVTYRDVDGGREEAFTHPAYKVLKDRPNPAMTRNTWLQVVAKDLFFRGEHFSQIRWRNNNGILGIYPICHSNIVNIMVDEEWNKVYTVHNYTGEVDVIPDGEILHFVAIPDDYGIRGVSFLKYASESLGLHKQVQHSATSYYRNAARPSGYIRYPGKLTPEAINTLRAEFKAQYQGEGNTGALPLIGEDGEFTVFPNTSAEDAKIIEALGSSVGESARWTSLNPLTLGDYSSSKYNSLAAENQGVYQKSLRWLLEAMETETNFKLFNDGFFAEFDTTGILRGDPVTQSQIDQVYLTSGCKLRNEVRTTSLNLPPLDGLDTPLAPLNQGAATTPPVTPQQLPPAPTGASVPA